MSVLICVSATEAETERLLNAGPRRDFIELAEATGGAILFQQAKASRGRVWRRLSGPHIRQAWHAAGRARCGDTVFADGEHIGIPLLAFLLLRFRRSVRVVMLGHLIARPWKAIPLAVLTRIGSQGTLVVHSVTQAERIQSTLGGRWDLRLVPYQVDTEFWRPGEATAPSGPATILAVGSEHRDYVTLSKAARNLDVHVRIAAGSHWARSLAAAGETPANVEYITEPLPFAELRAAYAAAAIVVVPLEDVANQSGVTTILEAMSMGRPVITTANAGQRECISGPSVDSEGVLDPRTADERGPQLFATGKSLDTDDDPDGYYVAPGDSAALRAAITKLLDEPEQRTAMGASGRRSACGHFTLDGYVDSLRDIIERPTPERLGALDTRVAP